MVGPDNHIHVVQLALAFDYALFFWVSLFVQRGQMVGSPVFGDNQYG